MGGPYPRHGERLNRSCLESRRIDELSSRATTLDYAQTARTEAHAPFARPDGSQTPARASAQGGHLGDHQLMLLYRLLVWMLYGGVFGCFMAGHELLFKGR